MMRALWVVAVSAALAVPGAAVAQGKYNGPEYSVKNEVVVKGKVTSVTTIPDWMGKDGVNIALTSPEAVLEHVDIATASFLEFLDFRIAVGDDLDLKGCWSETPKGPVFLVHEMKNKRVMLNVRDEKGVPLW